MWGPTKAEKYGEIFLPIIQDHYKKHETDRVENRTEGLNTSEELDAHAPELFERLRTKRKTIAEVEEVPAFVVFSDKTLKEMATSFPRTREAFLQIHGIGPAKVEKYADDFLPIIRDYCKENGID